MRTITEIRLANLVHLLETRADGSIANLNEQLGLDRTDATLAQIKNQNVNSGTGKPRGMGDALARRIEAALKLPIGYMDNVHLFESPEMAQRMEALHHVAQALGPYEVDQLIKIGAALAKPAATPASAAESTLASIESKPRHHAATPAVSRRKSPKRP